MISLCLVLEMYKNGFSKTLREAIKQGPSVCCWSRDQIWQACLVACPEFFHGVAGFLGVPAWSGHMRLSSCSQVNRESPLYSTLPVYGQEQWLWT